MQKKKRFLERAVSLIGFRSVKTDRPGKLVTEAASTSDLQLKLGERRREIHLLHDSVPRGTAV